MTEKTKFKPKDKPKKRRPAKEYLSVTMKDGQKYVLTEDQVKQVEMLAGFGLTVYQISSVLGMHRATLYEIMKREPEVYEMLERGRAKAVATVSQTAFSLAKSGKTPVMTMFWLKTQARWRENHPIEEKKPTGVVFRTRIGDKGQIYSEQTEEKQKNEEELPDL